MTEGPDRIVELRIHGVGGSDTVTMLGPNARPLSEGADDNSGFWLSTVLDTSPAPRPDAWQAFLWGKHDSWRVGLWLILLPFTLVNAAGWAIGSSTTLDGRQSLRRRIGAAGSRWLIAVVGVSLTVEWTLWMVAIVGDAGTFTGVRLFHFHLWAGIAIASGLLAADLLILRLGRSPVRVVPIVVLGATALAVLGNSFRDAQLRAVFGMAAATVATSAPFVLAGVNRKTFEKYRARLGGSGVARERRRLADEETPVSPCFFDHPTESVGLLFMHGAVALVILAVMAERGWAAKSLHPKHPFIGRSFLVLGLVQFALMVALLALAFLATSKDSAERNGSFWNGVVNALRAPSMVVIGVFMFTAVVGCMNAALNLRGVDFRRHAESELISAFLTGALIAGLIGVALAVRFYRTTPLAAGTPAGQEHACRRDLTLRWFVGSLDQLVAMTGVIIACALIAAAVGHRWSGDGTTVFSLRPRSPRYMPWLEASHRIVPALGWISLFAPFALAGATWLAVRGKGSKVDKDRAARRLIAPLASVWDVLGFWPRRFHPLGIPPEAERAVPELQSHLLRSVVEDECRVVIVAHSQGSVIACAALLGLRDRDAVARIDLVTAGSPLFVLYPRMFPGQVAPRMLEELATELLSSEGPRWRNVARPTDFFGIAPRSGSKLHTLVAQETADITTPAGPGPVELLAHSGYFHAPDLEGWATQTVAGLRARAIQAPGPTVASFAPRRRMASWFDPRLLLLTAYQAVVSAVFGRWADARQVEAIAAQAAGAVDDPVPFEPRAGDVWLDYVADEGDAFTPTFLVARALANPSLALGPVTLPRGRLLVFGGDQVYPVASAERYENQLIGPYELAAACVPGWEAAPTLLGLPGNHDWYDGLQSFDEVFCTNRTIGGWQTRQDRSYWSVRLTHGWASPAWWLWGVDLQLDNRFDHRQHEYFEHQLSQLQSGDFVILCSPIPTWAHVPGDATAFDQLMGLVERAFDEKGVRVVLHLSGDSHHYARYERGPVDVVGMTRPRSEQLPASAPLPVQYVTAGGGGAFTHPTHDLAQTIDLQVAYDEAPTLRLRARRPVADQLADPAPGVERPTKNESRRLVLRTMKWFMVQNPAFILIPAVTCAVAALGARFGPLASGHDLPHVGEFATWWLRTWLSLLVSAVVVVGWMAFAKAAPGGSKLLVRFVGLLHGCAQVVAMFFAAWSATLLYPPARRLVQHGIFIVVDGDRMPLLLRDLEKRVTLGTLSGVFGAVAACLLVSTYLWQSNRWLGMHDNEAASALASTKFKHFVRIRIRGAEATCWVLGVRHSPDLEAMFKTHDPRPRKTDPPNIELWDRFRVGVSRGPDPAPTGAPPSSS